MAKQSKKKSKKKQKKQDRGILGGNARGAGAALAAALVAQIVEAVVQRLLHSSSHTAQEEVESDHDDSRLEDTQLEPAIHKGIDPIKNAFSKLENRFSGTQSTAETLISALKAVVDELPARLANATETVTETVTDQDGAVQQPIQTVKNAAGTAIAGTIDQAKEAIEGIELGLTENSQKDKKKGKKKKK
jgi:hypothetical protein